MIRPSLAEFERLSLQGNTIPLVCSIPGDLETPLSAFLKIDDDRNSFLLESVEGGERWARYSFLGSDPRSVIRTRGDAVEIVNGDQHTVPRDGSDPTLVLKAMMAHFRPVALPELPEFFGGAVGYLAYDVVRNFERLPVLEKPDPGFHDAVFMVTRDMVIFDNLSHQMLLTTTVHTDEFISVRSAYRDGVSRLDRLRERLSRPGSMPSKALGQSREPGFVSNMDQAEFESIVTQAKDYIRAGDAIQVVLSQRFKTDSSATPLNIYRGLRMINPSPYMFFLRSGDEVLAGSSPEVMVRSRRGQAVLRPIAGTRPRGATAAEDGALEEDLASDEKEVAEHVMLVDLARNDLGRIAQPGSVRVDSFKSVERYSHVMHLVSTVRAKLTDGNDAFDVLRATFPAGTLSGAPKIRAMEIIEELEPERRGPYGGCVGYVSYAGAMDMGITIRTVMVKGSDTYVQAGAGIVADSIPEREYQETLNKAQAMRKALTWAQALEESRS